MPVMTGGQALVRSLIAEGVEVVFALPGAQIMHAFDASYDHPEIRLIVTRHEQATTYMADGYARATGKPGVALVVPGPGALNASAGLGTAYACSSPVFMLAGQIDSASLGKGKGLLHEVDDQLDIFRPITKWNHRVLKVEDIPGAVHEAMRQLKTGRPRPVELEIPPDVLGATAEADIIESEEYPSQQADPQQIEKAAQLLTSAERPAILAGGGAIISGASQELLEIAEFLQAPIVTTPEGKGVVSEDHYLCLGGSWFGVGPMKWVLPQADVLLAVGTRLNLTGEERKPSQEIVHIDVDPSEIGKNWPTAVGIAADAKPALEALLKEIKAKGPPKESRRAELERLKSDVWQEMKGLAPEQIGIVEAIQGEMDDDSVLVNGVTCIGSWTRLAYAVRRPRSYLTSSYFGTLGYAFPTALGAKVAKPDKQVVAISGDGGFMYSAQELSTAVKYGINVVTIVFNNRAFGASQYDQRNRFKGRYIGTDLHNPDFVKLAEAFGAVGLWAEDPAQLGPLLRRALNLKRPVVLEVVVPNMEPPYEIRNRPG